MGIQATLLSALGSVAGSALGLKKGIATGIEKAEAIRQEAINRATSLAKAKAKQKREVQAKIANSFGVRGAGIKTPDPLRG